MTPAAGRETATCPVRRAPKPVGEEAAKDSGRAGDPGQGAAAVVRWLGQSHRLKAEKENAEAEDEEEESGSSPASTPTAARSESPPFKAREGSPPSAAAAAAEAAKNVVASPVEYPSSWARQGLARGALAGGVGGGWYPLGRGTPALAATAASAVFSADVAPWMEATERALAPRHDVSLLKRSCTESEEEGDGEAEAEAEESVMVMSEPERHAETSTDEGDGSGREPAAPPPRVTLMASGVRTKEAPEEPGTERGSPVCCWVC